MIGVRAEQHMQLCVKPSKLPIGLTKQLNTDEDQEGKYFYEGIQIWDHFTGNKKIWFSEWWHRIPTFTVSQKFSHLFLPVFSVDSTLRSFGDISPMLTPHYLQCRWNITKTGNSEIKWDLPIWLYRNWINGSDEKRKGNASGYFIKFFATLLLV